MYSKEDVLLFVQEEDVQFIRLTYFDVFGNQKNVSILPSCLPKAFEKGVAIDSTAIAGFKNDVHTDLFLIPDPRTMTILPWRSSDGCVIFMICDIYYPDGRIFKYDSRWLLKQAVKKAREFGIELEMASKFEFYLFLLDDKGLKTQIPFDQAGYMDVSPMDRGENIRKEICLILEQMGLAPYKSYHQEGPGQNEIDFHFADALRAADEASIFKWVVKSIAYTNGVWADFSPKPIDQQMGNGMHVQIRFFDDNPDLQEKFMAGILKYIQEMTLFLNPARISYHRFGKNKAPEYVNYSRKTRFCLLRIPSLNPNTMEVRSPDCLSNPYMVFYLLIEAGLLGIEQNLKLEDFASAEDVQSYANLLPGSVEQAVSLAKNSLFIKALVPKEVMEVYEERGLGQG